MFSLLLGIGAIVMLSYLYFLASSVVYVASTKEIVSDMVAIQSSVSHLEGEYLQASALLSVEKADESGLQPIENTHFVKTEADTLTLLR